MSPTRTALVFAAQQSFATRGFTGTSIRKLSAAVGIKESSFYNHFPSKQALLDAVLEKAEKSLLDVARKFQIPINNAAAAAPIFESISLEHLEDTALGFLDMWVNDPDFVAARRLLTIEQYHTAKAGKMLRSLTIDRPVGFQSELFALLIAQGAIRSVDPTTLALAFWGPIFTILHATDAPSELNHAISQLKSHLQHFRDTYVLTDHQEIP